MCSSLQMEKEIKELKLQRDLAQSRLQDLLQVVGDNHGSKHPMVHETYCFLLYSLVLVVAHNKRYFYLCTNIGFWKKLYFRCSSAM